MPSVFKNISNKIMILIVGGKVIMSAAMNTDEGDFMRTDRLQTFAVWNRNQPLFCAVNDVGMAIYFPDPLIGS